MDKTDELKLAVEQCIEAINAATFILVHLLDKKGVLSKSEMLAALQTAKNVPNFVFSDPAKLSGQSTITNLIQILEMGIELDGGPKPPNPRPAFKLIVGGKS